MTDTEVICEFMEPKPKFSGDPGDTTDGGWWWMGTDGWWPSELTLHELHTVESRLISDNTMREQYFWSIAEILFGGQSWPGGVTEYIALLHATAEQKLKALAQVIRGAK